MEARKRNSELVGKPFYTEKVEMFDNEFLLFRTKQSGDIWQFRMWNPTEQAYIRKSTKQRNIERAQRVGTGFYKEILAGQDASVVNEKPKRKPRKGKGNRILEEHELFDGDIRIFRVAQSGKVWQVYIWVTDEQKAIKKSLRTKNLELARERAKEVYLDYITKQRTGQPIFSKEANELVDAYIKYQVTRQEQGSITTNFVGTLKSRMKHFLAFVGESTKLSDIKPEKFEGYRIYRRQIASDVKLLTLYNERGTIKALFNFAVQKKLIQSGFIPQFGEWEQIKKSGEKIHRDALTSKEWNQIYTYMQSWHTPKRVKNAKQAEQRKFIREFTLILCNSGIRLGEARRLQWRDIELYDETVTEDGGKKQKKRCKINLEGRKTKNGVARIAISRLGNPFVRLKKLSNFTKSEDFVFVDNDTGQQINKDVYYREWHAMLKGTGLDKSRKKIVYYSLRHTYATFQLYKNVPVYTLSKVMGCGVGFIQDHYGQIDIDKMRDQLTKDLRFSESGQVLFE